MSLYKYKTKFSSIIKASANFDDVKFISKASLDSLKPLIPASVDLSNNIDLIGVAFNAAVVNRFNKNHDGINTAAALALKNYFIHKPTNIEHNNTRIVGHIVNSGFSTFGENQPLSEQDVETELSPFNICLAAVVYKTVEKGFAEALAESSDPNSPWFGKISASWEIGFSDYIIAVGSKNVRDAILITDPEQIKEYSTYLKCNDGKGTTPKGEPVYRLITGKIYPLGIGFTSNPAAEVSGVITVDGQDEESEEEDDEDEEMEEEEDSCDETEEDETEEMDCIEVDSMKSIEKCSQISHIKHSNVILNQDKINTIMELEKIIAEFKAILQEKQPEVKFSEASIASVSEKIADSIRQESVRNQAKIEEAQKIQQEAIASADKLRADLDSNSQKLSETEKRLKDLEASLAAKTATDTFNVRMASLDAEYDFDDSDRGILAADLQAVASDEAFTAYKNKIAVLYKHKNKANKAEAEAEFNKRVEAEVAKRSGEVAKASAKPETDIESILAKLKIEKKAEASSEVSQAKDLYSKLAEAFSSKNVLVK
jgi:hypothetical protein